MHYFTYPMVSALAASGVKVTLFSNDVLDKSEPPPANVTFEPAFRQIYGPQPKWRRGLRYLAGLGRIGWQAFRRRPDTVHFHFNQIPMLDRLLFHWLKLWGISVAISVHDILPFAEGETAADTTQAFQQLYRAADQLIAHSIYGREQLVQLVPDRAAHCHAVPQGHYLDLADRNQLTRAAARTCLGLPQARPIVLIFGTLKPNKRLDIAFAALEQLAAMLATPPLFLVAGVAREYDVASARQWLEARGLADCVRWEDRYIQPDEVPAFYQAADVLLLPYAWIYQSATLVMAQSYGCPVVATDVGSNGEYVRDGLTGRLTPLTADAIANTLADLLNQPEKATQMATAAKRHLRENLGWVEIARQCLAIYQSALPRRPL
ncbi:MAG: glycosyltransferase family 4 protein [Anaerolineales bacterium]|nr:glycosyltransferase family 4 protein [Anaerolineales bacterium]